MHIMPAPKNPRKKPTKGAEPGTLFIRNVPLELLEALDDRIKALQTDDPLKAGLSRSALALDIIRRSFEKKGGAK